MKMRSGPATPMVKHLADGQGYFDGGAAKSMHGDFGFSGSIANKARGGAMPMGGMEPDGDEAMMPPAKPQRGAAMPGASMPMHPMGQHIVDSVPHPQGGVKLMHEHGGFSHVRPDGAITHHMADGAMCKGGRAMQSGGKVSDYADDPPRPLDVPPGDIGRDWGDPLPLARRETIERSMNDFQQENARQKALEDSASKGSGANDMHNATPYKKGGHADEAQDRVLFNKMMDKREAAEGEKPAMARGGRFPRLPRNMKPAIAHSRSPIETPPRNPNTTTTPRNVMSGGVMPYGVEPSAEANPAGSEQGIPQLRRGGKVR